MSANPAVNDRLVRPPGGHTIQEVTRQNLQTILDLEATRLTSQPFAHRLAERIAAFCGSMPFLWLQVAIFISWITYNSWPGIRPFDPFPFILLTLAVSLEAIFLSIFIMISQNYAARASERRHMLDLQINLLTEREITVMLRLINRIAQKMDVKEEDDDDVMSFSQDTCAEEMLAQIEAAEGGVPPRRNTPGAL